MHFKPQTPQGDGNPTKKRPSVCRFTSFQTTNPARGRKLVKRPYEPKVFVVISNHKPRKGTETLKIGTRKKICLQKFQTTNPARGRKRRTFRAIFLSIVLFQTTNPARGRKLSYYRLLGLAAARFQTTNPARGRKLQILHLFRKGFVLISNHKPRKGTETPFPLPTKRVDQREFQTTNPARGRKLVEHEPLSIGLDISKHEPRKGTEAIYNFPPFIYSFSAFQNTNPGRGGTGYDFLLMKSQPVVYVLSLQCILLMLN